MATRDDADRFGEAVAAQVRAEIAAHGTSVAGVARAAGINRETLDRWVKGERPLSVPTLFRVSAALGVHPYVIIQRAEERFRQQVVEATIAADNAGERGPWPYLANRDEDGKLNSGENRHRL